MKSSNRKARRWLCRQRRRRAKWPQLTRSGSYFPSFLGPPAGAKRALTPVVATSYLPRVSTRRMEKLATGVNAAGYRVILGIDVASLEDGASWPAFLRNLVAGACPASPR